jgi:hypothetical protein
MAIPVNQAPQPPQQRPSLSTSSRLITLSPDTYGNVATGKIANPQTGVGYFNITAGLIDHTSYGPISSGGWQVVDRPKQTSATQWFDRAPYKLDLEIILDKSVTNASSDVPSNIASNTHPRVSGGEISSLQSVEADCSQLELWLEPIPSILEPPTLKIDGPVPGTERTWFIYALDFTEAIRDFSSGLRVQQRVKITLYEYTSALATSTHTAAYSPAKAWTQNTIGSGVKIASLYTIKTGDTIQSIAGTSGNNYAQSILEANGLRDPSLLSHMVGEVIVLPE